MFCENCGQRIEEDSRFCPFCGHPTALAGQQAKEAVPQPAGEAAPTGGPVSEPHVESQPHVEPEPHVEPKPGESAGARPVTPGPEPQPGMGPKSGPEPQPGMGPKSGPEPQFSAGPKTGPEPPFGAGPQGEPQPYPYAGPEPIHAPRKKKSKQGLIIALIVVVILAAGGITFYLIWNSAENRMNRAIKDGDLDDAAEIYVEKLAGEELSEKTLSLLQEALDQVYPAYESGAMDYDDAVEELQALSVFYAEGWNDRVDAVWSLFDALNLKNDGSYESAISRYKEALELDPESEDAKAGLEEATDLYRQDVLGKAEEYISGSSDYEGAASVLQSAIDFLGGDEELEQKLTEVNEAYSDYQKTQEDEEIAALVDEAQAMVRAGEYDEALEYLESYESVYPDSQALKDAIGDMKQDIQTAIKEEANVMAQGGAYEDALELLEEYIPQYGSLQESYDAIYNEMPITLRNITTVSGEHVEVIDDALQDRWNNVYDGGVQFDASYDGYALYNLSGGFVSFQGTAFVGTKASTGKQISLSIYLDEELVFHQDNITEETAPISISLDLTGKQTMRITTDNAGTYSNGFLCFGNTSFARAGEAQGQSGQQPQSGQNGETQSSN